MKRNNTGKGSNTASKQSRLTFNHRPISSNPSRLLDWLQVNHINLEGIELRISDQFGSLGCFAQCRFDIGDTLFVVPNACLFGLRNVRDSELSRFIIEESNSLKQSHLCTAEFLLWINLLKARYSTNDSHFSYFNSLSESSPSILSWPSELIDAMNGTNLAASRAKLEQSMRQQAQLLSQIYTKDSIKAMSVGLSVEVCSFESLSWACGHYLSRRYPNHFQPIEESQALQDIMKHREINMGNVGTFVPLLDILNHNHEQTWLKFEVIAEGLRVICNHPRDKVNNTPSPHSILLEVDLPLHLTTCSCPAVVET
jgi:hypothetical protein